MRMLFALVLLAFVALLSPSDALATCTTQSTNNYGTHIEYAGSCTEDNEVLITTGDVSRYTECAVISTTGAVDIYVSIDGSNYTTDAVALVDLGAADTTPVLVTAALRYFAFPLVAVKRIKVLENGATDAAATLTCK